MPLLNSDSTPAKSPARSASEARRKPGNVRLYRIPAASGARGRYSSSVSTNQSISSSYGQCASYFRMG